MTRSAEPRVVIVSSEQDIHAYAVSKLLRERFACPSIIFDRSIYPNSGKMTAALAGNDNDTEFVFSSPFPFSLGPGQTVWWRRPEEFVVDAGVWDSRLRSFIRGECGTTVAGIIHASKCRVVNPIEAEGRASHKILQLSLARECGFKIPQTLVTNDREKLDAFRDRVGGEIIYKAQTDARYHMAETRVLDRSALAKLDHLALAPVIFQQMIPAAYDIRLTAIGQKLFAVRILSQAGRPKVDWRIDALVPMESMAVPACLVQPTLQLMRALGLDYGAIDLRVTPSGEVFFFEVNPSGQFLFCEFDKKLEITEALCELLVS